VVGKVSYHPHKLKKADSISALATFGIIIVMCHIKTSLYIKEVCMSKTSLINRRKEFDTLSYRFFDDWFSELSNFGFDLDCNPLSIFDVGQSKFSYPRVNILDKEKEVIIEATVPGLTKEDVQVEWCDNILTIGGKEVLRKESEEKYYKRREITKRKFFRSFTVYDSQFDCYNIQAEVKDGLLTIKLPKRPVIEEKKPEIKKIEIK
jgi:HSP20 family protein